MKKNIPATLSGALPMELHPGGAKRAVLGLHGYTGRTSDLKYLAERLASAGIAVSVPRLPGSGTDMRDLAATGRRDWIRRSYDAWQDLRSRYETVDIIGYSMGALLALNISLITSPGKLVLMAPALITRPRILALTPLFAPVAPIMPVVKTGWKPGETDDEDTREHGRRYWSRRDIRSAAQLARLSGSTRRMLKKVDVPVFAVISSNDPTVPFKVLKLLDERLPRGLEDSLTVKNCGHDLPQGNDREQVADTVFRWLTEESKQFPENNR